MSEPSSDGDPRAVLRDHGLWEEIDHPAAREHFENACKVGNVEAVRAYIRLGIDLNTRSRFSEKTPLIHAAEHDQCEIVRVLAAAGAHLQARDRFGRTALMTALERSHPAVLRTLLEVGASPDVPDKLRRYPLVRAVELGNPELIAIMLASKASTNVGGATRDSALHWCLRRNDGARLRELLARPNADPNLSTTNGDSLLHIAVRKWNTDAIEVLLDAGADPCRTNRWGWNPHEVAVEAGSWSLTKRFEQLGVPLNLEGSIAYFRLITRGDRESLVQWLDDGFPLETRDWSGCTGFLRAVQAGKREIAELLRERGADIDAIDGDDCNALSLARKNESEWVLQLGVSASYRDSHDKPRQPGLTTVLRDDDPELLRVLLGARNLDLSDLSDCRDSLCWPNGNDRIERRVNTLRTLGAAGADLEVIDDDGRSLLNDYIEHAVEPWVMALLDAGVDVDREDDEFTTPLIASCQSTEEPEIQARITAALLARGADPNGFGLTAWDYAELMENDACMQVLARAFEQRIAEHNLDFAGFHHLVRQREYELVRERLRAGFDPNPPPLDRHGMKPISVPLTIAIVTDEQMVSILLDGGADPNFVLWDGSTALFSAVGEQQVGMVRRLLAAGAHPDVCDDHGQTPMFLASSLGNIEIMQILLEAGATVQPRASGLLPLWAAARTGKLEAVQWLLARGANIDARCEGRITALIHAAKTGHVDLVRVLLDAGADTTIRDAQGKTAIDYAGYRDDLHALFSDVHKPVFMKIERHMPALIRAVHCGDQAALIRALAEGVDVTNYRGDTALMLAIASRQMQMVEALLEAGANVNARNAKDENAWIYAYGHGGVGTWELLEQHGFERGSHEINYVLSGSRPRHSARSAITAGDIARVAEMIDELLFDVDFLEPGLRPLELAIDRRDVAMVKLLITKGADASLPDSSGVPLRVRAEAVGISV